MKVNLFTLCLLLCTVLMMASAQEVTSVEENKAIADITTFIANQSQPNSGINNPAAKLLRLAFHDCPGGCDGCLNFNNLENNGLMRTYNLLNAIYDGSYTNTGISRADFVALAGIVAVRVASMQQDCSDLSMPSGCTPPMPPMTPTYGRRDCLTSPRTTDIELFPDAHGNLTHVLNYFRTEMNMTTRDVVAIIGAHSLGTTSVTRSGFNGPWAPPTTRFDNGFYRVLFGGGNAVWVQEELNNTMSPFFPTPHYQWTRPGGPRGGNGGARVIMLNSDMALLRDINPDADGRETNATCRQNSTRCPLSMTASIVNEFVRNNTAFMEAFGLAFEKVLRTGYGQNELVSVRQVGSEASPSSTPEASPSSTPEASPSPTPDVGATLQSILLLTITLLILAMLA